jgi:hypothetical protein
MNRGFEPIELVDGLYHVEVGQEFLGVFTTYELAEEELKYFLNDTPSQ